MTYEFHNLFSGAEDRTTVRPVLLFITVDWLYRIFYVRRSRSRLAICFMGDSVAYFIKP